MQIWGIGKCGLLGHLSLQVSFYMRPQGAALLTSRLKAQRVHVSGETGRRYCLSNLVSTVVQHHLYGTCSSRQSQGQETGTTSWWQEVKYLRRVTVLKMASSWSSWFEFLVALLTLSKDQSGVHCLCLNASSSVLSSTSFLHISTKVQRAL